jgi:hypothetical protein
MFRTALNALAGLTVPGISANYAIDALPAVVPRAELPVLLVLPLDPPQRGLFAERGAGFRVLGLSDGLRTVDYSVTHLLLASPANGRLSAALPALIDHIDAYFGALRDDVTLGDLLLEPVRVQVEPGEFEYGDMAYTGCAFRHTWTVAV